MYYYLLYVSESSQFWDRKSLKNLIEQSIEHNRKKGITGMLVYVQNRFIQILEGEKENVIALYEKIKQDQRHNNIHLILTGYLQNRNFDDWQMGFKSLEDNELESLTGYKEVGQLLSDMNIDDDSHPALVFLKSFFLKNDRDFVTML
jgi:hypothetical protein